MVYYKRFFKYGFIGAVMTIYGIIANYIGLEILNLPLYPTYVTVYISGIFISYYFNATYTFRTKISYSDSIKYGATYLLGLLIGIFFLEFFKTLFPLLTDFTLTVIVLPPRVLCTYFILKLLVFKKQSMPNGIKISDEN